MVKMNGFYHLICYHSIQYPFSLPICSIFNLFYYIMVLIEHLARLYDLYLFEIQNIMWELYSQALQKQYHAKLGSRSYLLSALCCVFAFIVPILILYSIGYSWNNYAPIFIQPTLSYQNHQISCLLDNKTLIYDSSFSSELTANSYSSFVGVGGDEGSYIITANIITNEISACSILIYFNVKLNKNLQSLAVLPINFNKMSTNKLSTLEEAGILYVKLISAIPQTSVRSNEFNNYYSNKTQVLNMNDIHKEWTINKNISLVSKITYSYATYASTTGSFTYQAAFSVSQQEYISEVRFITNLRTFIPFFIYLFILFWIFLAQPTVRWMLQNKIYRSKITHTKLKEH